MVICIIFIIIIAIAIGCSLTLAFEDEEFITTVIALVFLLGFNIAIFVCCAIPECKNQAIKDYTAGKYRKEVTYKMVQKDTLMVPVDSTIVYKPIKDEI